MSYLKCKKSKTVSECVAGSRLLLQPAIQFPLLPAATAPWLFVRRSEQFLARCPCHSTARRRVRLCSRRPLPRRSGADDETHGRTRRGRTDGRDFLFRLRTNFIRSSIPSICFNSTCFLPPHTVYDDVHVRNCSKSHLEQRR